MINSEVLEIKKRFRKDKASFYKVAGCYVDEKKEKVYTFNKTFLNLPEDEIFKYLEIVTKALSGKVGNNLLNIEFPVEAESSDGTQNLLLRLRDSEANDENILNELYDKIIASYQHLNSYLITLFFDKYDIPVKTKDKQKLDDSEEVFHYIICTLSPVELTQSALGYIDSDTGLGITARNLVVQAPETGFMFPSFNDRSTDIHSTLFYTKNTKLPHTEVIEDLLECEYSLTSAQKKTSFDCIVATGLADMPDEDVSDIIVDVEYQLQQMIEVYKAEHGETAVLKVNDDIVKQIVDDMKIDQDKKEAIEKDLCDFFEGQPTDASVLVSNSNLRLGEVRAEKQMIASALSKANHELDQYKQTNAKREYETRNINGENYMLVPTDKNTIEIDGITYTLVPLK